MSVGRGGGGGGVVGDDVACSTMPVSGVDLMITHVACILLGAFEPALIFHFQMSKGGQGSCDKDSCLFTAKRYFIAIIVDYCVVNQLKKRNNAMSTFRN